jgi:hypothetical protein
VLSEPWPAPHVAETTAELLRVTAAEDVASPAAEARLHHEGWSERGRGVHAEVARVGMRNARSVQVECRHELVVGGALGTRCVDDPDAAVLEATQATEPRLDPVQRGGHVEAVDDEIARTYAAHCLRGGHNGRVEPEAARGGDEPFVWVLRTPRKQEDAHDVRMVNEVRPVPCIRPVTGR